jgi:hypothetical protein
MTNRLVETTIADVLKKNRVRYAIIDADTMCTIYELYIASVQVFIQVELAKDDDPVDVPYIQLFTEVNDFGRSAYEETIEAESVEQIEEAIEGLLQGARRVTSAIAKIEAKIDEILKICEEAGLDADEYVFTDSHRY